jgi:hypothetical protein
MLIVIAEAVMDAIVEIVMGVIVTNAAKHSCGVFQIVVIVVIVIIVVNGKHSFRSSFGPHLLLASSC